MNKKVLIIILGVILMAFIFPLINPRRDEDEEFLTDIRHLLFNHIRWNNRKQTTDDKIRITEKILKGTKRNHRLGDLWDGINQHNLKYPHKPVDYNAIRVKLSTIDDRKIDKTRYKSYNKIINQDIYDSVNNSLPIPDVNSSSPRSTSSEVLPSIFVKKQNVPLTGQVMYIPVEMMYHRTSHKNDTDIDVKPVNYYKKINYYVISPIDGKIEITPYDKTSGYKIHIWGKKYHVFMCHLQKNSYLVKNGEKVKTGQRLAVMGKSGNAINGLKHVHLSVWKRKRKLSAKKLIKLFDLTESMIDNPLDG